MNGLILIGGKSKRMGESKGALVYHQVQQQYHLYHLLEFFCTSVYLSCKEEQVSNISPNYNCIVDKYGDIGPLGGILSAFAKEQNKAWFVVACDMPYVTVEDLSYLCQERIEGKVATVFKSKSGVEPLLGIWEMSSLPHLKTAFDEGKYGLRKILEDKEVNIIKLKTDKVVSNINTKAAYWKTMKDLNTGSIF